MVILRLALAHLKRCWRWSLRCAKIANAAGILTIILFLIGYCSLKPSLVRLHPEAVPRLSSYGAFEAITYANDGGTGEGLRQVRGPAVWLEGYVTNDGTALASGLALEVAVDDAAANVAGERVQKVGSILLGVALPFSSRVADVAGALPWDDWAACASFQMAEIGDWERLYLPPIPPGTYVQVCVGLPVDYVLVLTPQRVLQAVARGISVRLVQLTEPTRAMSSYGTAVPGSPVVLDELTIQVKDAFLDFHGVGD